MIFSEKEKDRLEAYLKKIKIEFSMKDRLDGWTIEWLKEKGKKIIIKNYLKDHRVFMTSVIAALTFGGEWIIHDKDSIKTSFPSFLKIINKINK